MPTRFNTLMGTPNYGYQPPNFDISAGMSTGNALGQAMSGGPTGTPPPTQPGMWSREAMWGGPNQTGWLLGAGQLGSSALGGFLGIQQLRMGRRHMRDQRNMATTNLANQASLTNRQLYNNVREARGAEAAQQELFRWGVSGVAGQTGYTGQMPGTPSNSGNTSSGKTKDDENTNSGNRRNNHI